jgi:hypothetical protein
VKSHKTSTSETYGRREGPVQEARRRSGGPINVISSKEIERFKKVRSGHQMRSGLGTHYERPRYRDRPGRLMVPSSAGTGGPW